MDLRKIAITIIVITITVIVKCCSLKINAYICS